MNGRKFGEQLVEGSSLRVGDIVLCQGSMWVLMGSYTTHSQEECYVCRLVPLFGIDYPPTFDDIDHLRVINGPVLTLYTCPENISPSEHREWVRRNHYRNAEPTIRISLKDAIKMNL